MTTPTIPTETLTTPADAPSNSYTRQLDARQRRHGFTPLVRAALDNGIDFETVEAYMLANLTETERTRALAGNLYGAPDLDAELTDAALDAALARSALAVGTIEHARLFWRGVL